MPRDKTDTFQKIIHEAKKQFLCNGYAKTSLRVIASGAGITAAGLYRHFPDKQSIFEYLVSPVLQAFDKMYTDAMEDTYALLDINELKGIWSSFSEKLSGFVEFIYTYFDELKLLLCCSKETKYQNFQHDLVLQEVKETQALLEEMRIREISVEDIHEDELHMVTSAYLAAIFEVVIHDYSKEKAQEHIDFIARFFYLGWKNILGF